MSHPTLPSPLIPLPESPPKPKHEQLRPDLYSPLFNSSPTSSSIFRPLPNPIQNTSVETRPSSKPTLSSIFDDDFGSFISVPPSQDPLHIENSSTTSDTQSAVTGSSYGSFTGAFDPLADNLRTTTFTDEFFESAKSRSKENEQRVLKELIEHEDDPMYWLTGSTSSKHDDLLPPIETFEDTSSSPSIEQLLIDIDLDSNHFAPPKLRSMSPISDSATPSPSKRQNSSPTRRSSPPSAILRRKSSLPTLSSSPPAGPIHDPMSMSMTHGSPSRSAKDILGTINTASIPASPPSRPSYLTSTATLSKSFFNTLSGGKTVTHQTPFASQIFIPPSGAPGFEGDHTWNKKGFDFDEAKEKSNPKSVLLKGRNTPTSEVLNADLATRIRSFLPPLARLTSSWTLLYSLDQHGISLSTFYQQCSKHEGGCLLVIQDAEGAIFGAWISEPLKEQPGSFYGTGDSFLWKENQGEFKVYKWTGMNDYVALCEHDSVSFGGGEGHYGLYLSASLIEGSSARCPTFNNEVLCSESGGRGNTVEFESIGVEVWGVQIGG